MASATTLSIWNLGEQGRLGSGAIVPQITSPDAVPIATIGLLRAEVMALLEPLPPGHFLETGVAPWSRGSICTSSRLNATTAVSP
jgi:hypothetical protein